MFSDLLGDSLCKKDGKKVTTVATSEAMDGAVIGLYFSAHWCPPCRGFTPKLAEQYKSLRASGKRLQVVFVSSDHSASAFDEYFSEMPQDWFAVPFADRKRKETLSRQFKVRGIPTLVLLDGESGQLLTTNGRTKVMQSDEFPWQPKSLKQLLGDSFVKTGSSEPQKLDSRVVGLYFSAHWCPPCRGFTPVLAEKYKQLRAAGKDLEIVFLSSDRDQAAFDEYLSEMPWIALPYEKRKEKEALSEHFEVEGIPTLVFVDMHTGKTINTNGRAAVSAESFIEDYPFHPKPVNDVSEGCGDLNDMTSLVLLMEKADADVQAAAEAALHDVAEAELLKAEQKRRVGAFFTAKNASGVTSQIRKLVGLKDIAAEDNVDATLRAPQMVLLDIPDKGGFYMPDGDDAGEISATTIEAMIAAYHAGKLQRKQLSS